MIDIENEVYTKVSTAVKAVHSDVKTASVTILSPSELPFLCIEETDNFCYTESQTNDLENHCVVTYELNVFSNKASGKKSQCKEILKTADEEMRSLGFSRITSTAIVLDDATKYRLFARYQAVVSKDQVIYRR